VPDHQLSTSKFKENGYVYVPNSCLKKECDLHISLHGLFSGFKDWITPNLNIVNYAATNDLIVLYPMAEDPTWFTG
jgi:hypothetical protein